MGIIEFSKACADVERQKRAELEQQLSQLRKVLAELDAQEPKNSNSEAYEDWADRHEDLEDQIDEVLDRLEDLDS